MTTLLGNTALGIALGLILAVDPLSAVVVLGVILACRAALGEDV